MNNRSETSPITSRRRVLGAIGAGTLTAVAGCSGGDGDGGDTGYGGDGGDGDGGDGSTGDVACTDMTNGYDTEDVGERPMFFDFEYPTVFGELEYEETTTQAVFGLELDPPGEAFFEHIVQQSTEIETEPAEVLDWEEASKTGFSIATTFNDEEVTFAGDADPNTGTVFLNGNLPYEIDGERRLFRTKVTLVAQEEGEECTESLREAVEHVVGSLTLNDDTTLGA